jgi:hypothetical protein
MDKEVQNRHPDKKNDYPAKFVRLQAEYHLLVFLPHWQDDRNCCARNKQEFGLLFLESHRCFSTRELPHQKANQL